MMYRITFSDGQVSNYTQEEAIELTWLRNGVYIKTKTEPQVGDLVGVNDAIDVEYIDMRDYPEVIWDMHAITKIEKTEGE